MKSITEQVDEFIEGWHNGSILFSMTYSKSTPKDRMWVSEADSKSQVIMDSNIEFIDKNLKQYLAEEDGDEHYSLAFQIYGSILLLRGLGVIRNNPNSLNELQFYKNRCESAEQKVREQQQRISELSTKILNMTSPPDPKIGTH